MIYSQLKVLSKIFDNKNYMIMSTRKYRVCKNDRRYLEYEYNGQWILFPSDSAPIDFGFIIELQGEEVGQQCFVVAEDCACHCVISGFICSDDLDRINQKREKEDKPNMSIWDDLHISDIDNEEARAIMEVEIDKMIEKIKKNDINNVYGPCDRLRDLVLLLKDIERIDYISLISGNRLRGDLLRTVFWYLLWLLKKRILECFESKDRFKHLRQKNYFCYSNNDSPIKILRNLHIAEADSFTFDQLREAIISLIELLDDVSEILNANEKTDISDIMNPGEFEGFPFDPGQRHWILCRFGMSKTDKNINMNSRPVPDFVAESIAYEDGVFDEIISPERFIWKEAEKEYCSYYLMDMCNSAFSSWDIVPMAYWWCLLAWKKLGRYENEKEFLNDVHIGERRSGIEIYRKLVDFDKNINKNDRNLPPLLSLRYYKDGDNISKIDLLTVAIEQLHHLYGSI